MIPETPLDQPEVVVANDNWKFMLYLGIAICSAGVVGHYLHYYPAGAMLVTVGLLVMHVRSSIIFFTQDGKEIYQFFFYIGRTMLVAGVSLVFWNIRYEWLLIIAGSCYALGMFLPAKKDGPLNVDDY